MAVTAKALFRGSPITGATTSRANISNKAVTTNLATITTSAAHGITQVGTIVTIQGVDTTFDGTWVIHSIPTSTTFTFVSTTATVGSTAVSPVGVATFNTGITTAFLVTNKVIQNYVATLTTASAHGLAVGDIVAVTIGDTTIDTLQARVIAVPTTTTFSYIVTTQTLGTAAVTQGAMSRLPAVYTVPALTTTAITNAVVTNHSPNATTFTVMFDGVPLALAQPLAAGASTYFDMRQVLATTKTAVLSASSPLVQFHISGVEVA